MDPGLFPLVTALIALAGVALGAGLTWLANRSNARLQIEGQRQLAANARRYERRRSQLEPYLVLVREQVALSLAFLAAADGRPPASDAELEALYDRMLAGQHAIQAWGHPIPQISTYIISFAARTKSCMLWVRAHFGPNAIAGPSSSRPQSEQDDALDVLRRQHVEPLAHLGDEVHKATEAYLDELPREDQPLQRLTER